MNKLGEMAASGNWNAVKYILDGVGYKPEDKTKVSVEADSAINLTIGKWGVAHAPNKFNVEAQCI